MVTIGRHHGSSIGPLIASGRAGGHRRARTGRLHGRGM